MFPGTCHPLTIVFLVWPLLSGEEGPSVGTTSNSEEVFCIEKGSQGTPGRKPLAPPLWTL